MRQPISFAEFLKLPEDVQESMGRLENENLTEELSPTAQKKLMISLERKLKDFDFWYVMGDNSAWKKGKKAEEEIYKIMDELGTDDAKSLYKMYAKKSGMNEALISNDGISPSTRSSIKSYMKDLDKLCRKHNWEWQYEEDETSFRKGRKEEQEIRELVVEIKELGSIEGFDLYTKYAARNGIKIKYFLESRPSELETIEDLSQFPVNEIKIKYFLEALKDPRPSAYEKHLYKKMKEWGIKDLDELEGEAKVRFHAELDADAPDPVEESKSIFPEQNVSSKNIQLGYGEERPVGGKSNHGFCDPGNLYDNTTTWQPPSNERKKRL